jgi:hypothetical protein
MIQAVIGWQWRRPRREWTTCTKYLRKREGRHYILETPVAPTVLI